MKTLNTTITNEIRYILEGCRSGRLQHYQGTFHKKTSCGTAHCIAGWNMVLKNRMSEDVAYWCGSEWTEYQNDWQLTETEANLLFNGTSTFRIQFSLLETLEAGCRIRDNNRLIDTFAEDDENTANNLESTPQSFKYLSKRLGWRYFLDKVESYEYPKNCNFVKEILKDKTEVEEVKEEVYINAFHS